MHTSDATETTRLQRELKARANQALAARAASENQRKDIFIATVAHELRNMLGPMNSALEILDRARSDRELSDRALSVARRQMRHLCHLVDELLDIGRIVNGQVLLDREPLQLQQVVEETLAACEPMFAQRQLTVATSLCATPVWLVGDPVRWAQILTNLLHNAAKFTPPGGRVGIELTFDEDDRQAELRVTDTGRGIARGELESIFAIFAQAGRERGTDGLGVGLSLVRRLVELHGGRIHAESAGRGRGATFVIRVPARSDAPHKPAVRPGSRRFGRQLSRLIS